ncbi:nitroreductase family protein [Pseudoflavonifractor phocaeensis]|uniref:nitroreductase family protein n=1 Tax=Pseudoflavonifractor phocaeensis TaxID=1870988 RepID=UPI00195A2943|nr:nitroreductase family protein [Pseudoflavonifractor phocaeensis]MBM6927359.1 nitroreductase family protein [Pseudoflavonifractor phocaeensis]
MKELFARRSIRKYLDIPVTPEQIERLLRAGMAAPSAGDGREWSFLVVQSQEGKEKFMSAHDASGAVKTAPLLIMVCARFREEVYAPEGFWVQDCAAAIENMLIEATYLGLGSLWMAIYPRQHRIARIRTLFGIPEEVIPFGAVAIGVPARGKPPIDRYMADYVYLERYGQRLDGR